MSIIENKLLSNRSSNQRSLTVYLNCGDPSIEITGDLIKLCELQGVDVIELGVPFPNSFTDGGTVLRSHERALKNQVTFEDVIQLVKKVRTECKIPIVLLADFSHSVKSRGIRYVVEQSSISGVNGLLLHGLPPLFLEEYIKQTTIFGIDPIFSLYPNSTTEQVSKTVKISKGFIYLVSQYGRSGDPIDFQSSLISDYYSATRAATNIPLMAGFGVKNYTHMKDIFSNSDIDGVIIGSAICSIIEDALTKHFDIKDAVNVYLNSICAAKVISYKSSYVQRDTTEYAS